MEEGFPTHGGSKGANMGSLENKIAIIRAMDELMAERSLEEIRTVDICAHAGVSRQTFYRNFSDKYQAAIWFMEEGAWHSVRQIGVTCGWKTGHRRLFSFVAGNRRFIKRFFQMNGSSALGKTLMEKTVEQNFVEHYCEQYAAATGREPDGCVEFQIKAFAKMSIECIKEWQSDPHPDQSEEYIDAFLSAVPRDLFKALDIEDKPSDASIAFPLSTLVAGY